MARRKKGIVSILLWSLCLLIGAALVAFGAAGIDSNVKKKLEEGGASIGVSDELRKIFELYSELTYEKWEPAYIVSIVVGSLLVLAAIGRLVGFH